MSSVLLALVNNIYSLLHCCASRHNLTTCIIVYRVNPFTKLYFTVYSYVLKCQMWADQISGLRLSTLSMSQYKLNEWRFHLVLVFLTHNWLVASCLLCAMGMNNRLSHDKRFKLLDLHRDGKLNHDIVKHFQSFGHQVDKYVVSYCIKNYRNGYFNPYDTESMIKGNMFRKISAQDVNIVEKSLTL